MARNMVKSIMEPTHIIASVINAVVLPSYSDSLTHLCNLFWGAIS